MNLKSSHSVPVFAPARVRSQAATGSRVAFTMIEIAISLAIIGFAMVAIIGILPTGMSAQRENREETIINQDASIFLEAIRNGARGVDDLTNYIVAITNATTEFDIKTNFVGKSLVWHTFDDSSVNPPTQKYMLTNGFRIIGLLSTPKLVRIPLSARINPGGFYSNYIVATVRSLSGPANEKYPQTNSQAQDLAFTYRIISDLNAFTEFDTNWAWAGDPDIAANTNEIASRSNYWQEVKNLQTNLWDLRLTFRWPIKPNGQPGNGRQVFRTLVGGKLLQTNDFIRTDYPLYFFEPRTFVKAP